MFHSIIELLMYKCIIIMEIKTSLEDKRKKKEKKNLAELIVQGMYLYNGMTQNIVFPHL